MKERDHIVYILGALVDLSQDNSWAGNRSNNLARLHEFLELLNLVLVYEPDDLPKLDKLVQGMAEENRGPSSEELALVRQVTQQLVDLAETLKNAEEPEEDLDSTRDNPEEIEPQVDSTAEPDLE